MPSSLVKETPGPWSPSPWPWPFFPSSRLPVFPFQEAPKTGTVSPEVSASSVAALLFISRCRQLVRTIRTT